LAVTRLGWPLQASNASARDGVAVLMPVFIATLVAWTVAFEQMRGMDAGPGTDLGSFGWFIGIWVTMTAAMMLPSAAPAVLLFSHLGRGLQTVLFVGGYLLAWTAFGASAYAVSRIAHHVAPSFVAWDERGPWVAGAALAAAGLYQLTPLKTVCLRHCRSPLRFLLRRRGGHLSALRAGLGHGGYCIGCCAGLMVALFALGIMSVFWMAVAAVVILVEKTLPRGEAFARVLALALVVLGTWIALSPGTVPGLQQPDRMQMQMQP
jgi:predicted metal-binding membrane protein